MFIYFYLDYLHSEIGRVLKDDLYIWINFFGKNLLLMGTGKPWTRVLTAGITALPLVQLLEYHFTSQVLLDCMHVCVCVCVCVRVCLYTQVHILISFSLKKEKHCYINALLLQCPKAPVNF